MQLPDRALQLDRLQGSDPKVDSLLCIRTVWARRAKARHPQRSVVPVPVWGDNAPSCNPAPTPGAPHLCLWNS